MLSSVEIIELVYGFIQTTNIPVIFDPVMVAKDGTWLLDADATEMLKDLISECYLLTPNIPEAEILADMKMYKEAVAAAEMSSKWAEEEGNDGYVKMNEQSIAKWKKMK